jgi:protein-S-isoprenylcysteine O-methyltransferase Ste14
MSSVASATRSAAPQPVEDRLSLVQRRRKQFAFGSGLLLLLVLLFTESMWPSDTLPHESLELLGYGLILLCIAGRTWCSLYIGGRKKKLLVDQGPYSLSRNPLYLFSVLGGIGVGLQAGNVVTGVVLGLFVFALFSVVIAQEEGFLKSKFEGFLKSKFPEDFAAYAAKVPRWGPRFSRWHSDAELTVQPRMVLITFRDALSFLIAIPLLEGIEILQNAGWLPVLLHLP